MYTTIGAFLLILLAILIYLAYLEEKRTDQYYKDLYDSKEELKDNSAQMSGEEIVSIAEEIQKQEEPPKNKKSRPRKKPASKSTKKD